MVLKFLYSVKNTEIQQKSPSLSILCLINAVNDRKCVFHFRPKPNIWPEKHLALGRIPKPKPNVQIYIKIGGILKNSMFLMPYVTRHGSFFVQFW